MEGVIELNVPLVADVGTGDNWRDAQSKKQIRKNKPNFRV